MLNNEPTLDELKGAADLVQYVIQHTPLKKSGKEYMGCCPLHGEKTPSFSVNEEKQQFHCFGCGAGGSVIDFIMSLYGVDTFTAINQLKAHLGYKEGDKLEVERRLTDDQKLAETMLSECEIVSIDRENGVIPDACSSLADFGIFSETAYSFKGKQVVPLRSKNAIEDVLLLDSGRGETLSSGQHSGYAIVGAYDDHSQHLYIAIDYIDAIYLHKIGGGNNLIVFAPHLYDAMSAIKRDYPQREIRLALPNTNQGHKILETYVGRYVMPSEVGYFCERDRKQAIEGVRYAK